MMDVLFMVLDFMSEYKWYLLILGWIVVSQVMSRITNRGPFPVYENHKITSIESVGQWSAFLKENNQVVVDFYATWCPPCRMCAVPYGKLSEEYDEKGWKFAKVDVDQAKEVAFRADIKSMPTFKVYKDGKEIQQFRGFQPGGLKEVLDSMAKKQN
ncbi:unnamed protein product [Amoebophrya sp. A120]|nr:unnamed protein product [Amoebophrya sp. A120]|eukprot:GSA120T00017970001.1